MVTQRVGDLLGMGVLWKIAITCTVESVSLESKAFLAELYLATASEDKGTKKGIFEQFIKKCLADVRDTTDSQGQHELLNRVRLVK